MERIRITKLLGFTLVLAGAFFLCTTNLLAQQEPKLDLKSAVEKEVKVNKQGKWVLGKVPAEKTAPGDILVFTITYANTGKSALVDASIVNPVPAGVTVNPESAEGKDAQITCSIDNAGSFHTAPIMETTKKPDGTLESKPVPLDRYTHIRWVIKKPVQPGQSGRVSFKATVR